ncbi:MAG: hypothetical protein H6574_16270 [Lewinellaceae bacterium]|nr:hypothetical protein [Lewinellaceae bacterium]
MILEQINIIEFVLLFCTAFKLIYPRFNKPIYCANAEQNGQLAAWSIDLIRAKWVVLFFCLGFSSHINAQSPHGPDFKVNCADCHLTTSWEIPYDAWDRKGSVFSKTTGWQIGWDTAKFSHTKTNFPLTGQHIRVDCRTCHESLVFSEAKSDCFACHTDVHQQTLGMDCTRCHNTENWLVDFIPELHQDNGFPLLGAHAVASCTDCHTSETQLRFDRIGNDCINCHLDDFQATKSPDHVKAGFSTNCVDCHDPAKTDWGTTLVDHSFFPLEKGHQINDCTACHSGGTFSNTPTDCYACHQADYEAAANPNHQAANFALACTDCHTTDAGWMPASFARHDADYFPIYSGEHQGAWMECVDCHKNPGNYAEFTCVSCHQNPETDDAHGGVNGYSYNDQACLACHPSGDATDVFDHNNTAFPLTGAHQTAQCIDCHANGYVGTPTDCVSCHDADYAETSNPDHNALGIQTDCATCHTTDAWNPAEFPIHDNYYPLNGAHAAIANDCAGCHNGDYNNTPNTCAGCHQADYDATTNPNHAASQFPNDCTLCHTETAWTPATFDHNNIWPLTGAHASVPNCTDCHLGGNFTNTPNTCAGCHQPQYDATTNPNHGAIGIPTDCETCHTSDGWMPATFPLHDNYYPLNGAHAAIATDCAACHNGNYNNTPNTCAGCHQADYAATTDPDHTANLFPDDCTQCHSETAWVPATFDHNATWPLTGAHASVPNCTDCHTSGNYSSTPNTCAGCHQPQYDATTNPNHNAIGIPTDCETCHTSDGWMPATFPLHDNYYPLNGAHATIANDCAACHNGDYNNTPNTCAGCHQADYDATTNPNHQAAQFNTDCAICHSETTWSPSNFDHDNQYFPIYSGKHEGEWAVCTDCHSNPANYMEVTCTNCHLNPTTDNEHTGVNGYVYLDQACLACHPTGDASVIFDHNTTAFPLTGVHLTTACIDCHTNGFQGTPTECAACHTVDFNATTNPNHTAIGIPTDCETCHTTAGWAPALFPIHDNYYMLNGAHASISNACATCHNGDYNNTPNTCAGCHQADYDGTTNPDHNANQFSTNCTECHSEAAWSPTTFDHSLVWPLNGAHANVPNCTDCHIGGNFSNTPNTCVGCHQGDYDATTDPNHAANQFPTDCTQCHNENAWAPSTFDHNAIWPLTGAHANVPNCSDCHIGGNYTNTPNTCAGCHQTDYDATTNPNHQALGIPTDCETCHTSDGWMPATFPIHNNYYQLNGAHTAIANDCAACHNGNYNNTPNTCAGCHQADFNATTDPNHVTNQFPTDCTQCHDENAWAPSTFDHNTVWPLTGAHASVPNCTDCHIGGNYTNTPNTCVSCHQADYDATTNPNHVANQFSTDCTQCHNENGWVPATFDHNTVWPLNGAHANVPNCTDCHIGGNYNNTPNTCVGCHQTDYNATTNPNHVTNQFSTDCTQCHNENGWVPSTFDHNTIWPLTGAHANVPNCSDCHIGGNYANTPNTCVGCHQPDFNATTNPNHVVLGIPTACETCHTTDGWMPAEFPIHNNYYPLNGAHAAIANDCAACHNGDYNNTPNTCVGCHQPDYDASANPSHTANQFPTDCTQCHDENAWAPSTFNHNTVWPLNGAHASVPNCIDCHTNGNYTTTPNTCVGCHQADYNATTNPNHLANQFATDCTQCHNETGWVPSTFDHNTVWPLTGAHASVPNCIDCHVGGNYNNTPNTCVGCHQPDYNATTNPNHQALGIPTDCETCHTNDGWIPADFPIHNNYYQLNGAHQIIANDCAACHNGNYNNTPNTCVGCHLPDYNATTNPNHSAAGFPTDCTQCHDETAWVPSTFDHNTIWPLNGAHASIINCTDCHIGGNFNNTPNTCVGCHQADYNATTNPNHSAAGFPTDCTQCHDETAWVPSTFDHNTIWPLNGAHANVPNCTDCHIGGNFNNTPNTCVGCHQADYNGANNPNHLSAGFPTDCTLCHNETAWDPSTFDHDNMYFPIYSGKHKDEWNTCSECHTTSGNFMAFSCIDCHEHDDPADMADKHDNVSGYVYSSPACYACHPDGKK